MTLPIEFAVQHYPQNIAFTDGQIYVTYAELNERIEEFSDNYLAGLRPGEHVAWSPGNNLKALVTFWAIQNRGLVACPISFRFSEEQKREVLQANDARWLPEFRPVFDGSSEEKTYLKNQHDDLELPATIILSSGSTGRPKAVVHSMAAHVANAEGAATNMPLGPDDRWLWSLPMFHVSGLSILIRCAMAGATVVGLPDNKPLSASVLSDTKITHLSVVGTQLRRLMEEATFPSSHLKWVLLGGSSVDPKLVQASRSRGVNVLTTYGLSETASQVSTSTIEGDPSGSGKVLHGREVKIDDSGQILIRGKTLCLGYYRGGQIESVMDEDGWFANAGFWML